MSSCDLEIFVDGACKGNPGAAAIGVVIFENQKKIKEVSRTIGEATNNIAEYKALLCALEEAKLLKASKIKIYTDSELMFYQFSGRYQVKSEHLKIFFDQAQKLAKEFKSVEIKNIPREKNKEADQLATQALKNKQVKMVAPTSFSVGEESPSSKG